MDTNHIKAIDFNSSGKGLGTHRMLLRSNWCQTRDVGFARCWAMLWEHRADEASAQMVRRLSPECNAASAVLSPNERAAESQRAQNPHLLPSGRRLFPVTGFPQKMTLENFKALSWPASGSNPPDPPVGPERDRRRVQSCALLCRIPGMFAFPLIFHEAVQNTYEVWNLVTRKGVHETDLRPYMRGKKGRDANKWANNILELSWDMSLAWKTTVNKITFKLSFVLSLSFFLLLSFLEKKLFREISKER